MVLNSLLSTTKAPVNYASTVTSSTTHSKTFPTTKKDKDKKFSIITPSAWVDIRLVNRKGINLVLFANGTVAGTWNNSLTKVFGLFRIQSHGPSLVKLKSLKTKKYIAINSLGKIYSTGILSNQEALLVHEKEENHFYSFSSYLYPTERTNVTKRWLLAIGSKGRIRNATRVSQRHKSHQFQIIEIRKDASQREPTFADLDAIFRDLENKGKEQ
ncbi:putative fibroblast growth factor1 [Porites harrisoni]